MSSSGFSPPSQAPGISTSGREAFCRVRLACRRLGGSAAALLLTSAVLPAHAGILLTEIHYNGPASGSDPDEFIEISNAGMQPVDLTGWRFSEGVRFEFSAPTTLQSGGSLVISKTPASFLSVFPDFSGSLFDFAGALSNSGEALTLQDAMQRSVWRVSYDDRAPWPTLADGLGPSLQLLADARDSEPPENWIAAAPTPGRWARPEPSASEVSVSDTLSLCAGGLAVLFCARRRLRNSRRYCDAFPFKQTDTRAHYAT